MENRELYIVNQVLDEMDEENKDFVIDTDEKAEWAIKKIAEERAETQRIISVCQSAIKRYIDTIKKTEDALESKTVYLTFQLQRYMGTVKAKESKTQKTYKLPSGTLKIKKQGPEFKRDEGKLTEFLMKNKYTDYIETQFKPKWAEFKKTIDIQRDPIIDEETGVLIDYTPYYVVDANGKRVEGIEVVEREDKFEVVT